MLEWKKSQDDILVPVIQGQSVGSLRAHRAESQKWVERVAPLCQDSETVIVLGLGSGTHIKELQTKFPDKKIVVLDFFVELMSPLRAHNQLPTGASIYFLNEIEDVFKCEAMSDMFAMRPPVLLFGPMRLISSHLYENLQMTITSRNPVGRAHFRDWLKKNEIIEKEQIWETLGELLKTADSGPDKNQLSGTL